MNRWIVAAARGARAGLSATLPMTAWMSAKHTFDRVRQWPPPSDEEEAEARHDATAGLEKIGVERMMTPAEQDTINALSHFGIGTALGAAFGLLREAGIVRGGIVGGAAFGTAVWAATYAGLLPALSIVPGARTGRREHPLFMLSAHWVYGVELARNA